MGFVFHLLCPRYNGPVSPTVLRLLGYEKSLPFAFYVPRSTDAQIFSTRYPVTRKVYTGYHGTSEIEHGLSAYTVVNPLAKARGLSLYTDEQTMLYLSHVD